MREDSDAVSIFLRGQAGETQPLSFLPHWLHFNAATSIFR